MMTALMAEKMPHMPTWVRSDPFLRNGHLPDPCPALLHDLGTNTTIHTPSIRAQLPQSELPAPLCVLYHLRAQVHDLRLTHRDGWAQLARLVVGLDDEEAHGLVAERSHGSIRALKAQSAFLGIVRDPVGAHRC